MVVSRWVIMYLGRSCQNECRTNAVYRGLCHAMRHATAHVVPCDWLVGPRKTPPSPWLGMVCWKCGKPGKPHSVVTGKLRLGKQWRPFSNQQLPRPPVQSRLPRSHRRGEVSQPGLGAPVESRPLEGHLVQGGKRARAMHGGFWLESCTRHPAFTLPAHLRTLCTYPALDIHV